MTNALKRMESTSQMRSEEPPSPGGASLSGVDSRVGSEASTTFSEFVRKRQMGTVPVFGGDIRTGARQFGHAIATSVSNSAGDIQSAVDVLYRAVLRKAEGEVHAVASVNADEMSDFDLDRAAALDSGKIKELLRVSCVSPEEVQTYQTLLDVTKSSLLRKQLQRRMDEQRRVARDMPDNFVSDREIALRVSSEQLGKALDVCGYRGEVAEQYRVHFRRALVHDSVFSGRTTNRVLAMLGGAAMRAALIQRGYEAHLTGAAINDEIVTKISNANVARIFRQSSAVDALVLASPVERAAPSVLSTACEALYGAVYLAGGMDDVVRVAEESELALDQSVSKATREYTDDGKTPTGFSFFQLGELGIAESASLNDLVAVRKQLTVRHEFLQKSHATDEMVGDVSAKLQFVNRLIDRYGREDGESAASESE